MKDRQKYFKKNLHFLQATHPPLAYQLTMNDPVGLEFCGTQQEEPNLKRAYEDRNISIIPYFCFK